MKKYFLALSSCLIVLFLNVLPLLFQKLEMTVIISNLLTWVIITIFVFSTNFIKNRFVNAVLITLLIYLPNFVYIFSDGLFSFLWVLLSVTASAVIFGFFANLEKEKEG